jgi:hypothetical protein
VVESTRDCMPLVPQHMVSTYSPEIGSALLAKIAEGKTTEMACREVGVAASTFWHWRNAIPELEAAFWLAKEKIAERYVDEIVTIADTAREATKTIVRETKDGTFESTETGDAVDRSRLMVTARQWAAERLAPRRFGSQVNVEHAGGVVLQVSYSTGPERIGSRWEPQIIDSAAVKGEVEPQPSTARRPTGRPRKR